MTRFITVDMGNGCTLTYAEVEPREFDHTKVGQHNARLTTNRTPKKKKTQMSDTAEKPVLNSLEAAKGVAEQLYNSFALAPDKIEITLHLAHDHFEGVFRDMKAMYKGKGIAPYSKREIKIEAYGVKMNIVNGDYPSWLKNGF